jgi:hypothetical protein
MQEKLSPLSASRIEGMGFLACIKARPGPCDKCPAHTTDAKVVKWVAHGCTCIGTRGLDGEVYGNAKLVSL